MKKKMKKILDTLYLEMNSLEKIYPDPVFFVHRFKNEEDVEIAALISGLFAFGKVDLILKNLELIFSKMQNSPYLYLKNTTYSKIQQDFKGFCYRFVNEQGMTEFLYSLSQIVKKHGSLKDLLIKNQLIDSLDNIRTHLLKYSKSEEKLLKTNLIADLKKGSPAKRWMLFSRWMVRKDNVDIGLWNELLSPKNLIIPLDTHILRIGGYLNFTNRKNSSMKTALEITESLKKIDKEDPVKYDFAICHLGIRNFCTVKKDTRLCKKCPLSPFCKEKQ